MTTEQLESQITEMWSAMAEITGSDEAKDAAVQLAHETERKLRARHKAITDPVSFAIWLRNNAEFWGDSWAYEGREQSEHELFEIYLNSL
jgi:hypothetical protein